MHITEAMHDPNLFQPYLDPRGKGMHTWQPWAKALGTLYGTPRHGLFLTGRRAGCSTIAAMVAVYEAALAGHEGQLSPMEEGLVPLVTGQTRQAARLEQVVAAIFQQSPTLGPMLVEHQDGTGRFHLSNGIVIRVCAVHHHREDDGALRAYRVTAGTLRGETMPAAVLDNAGNIPDAIYRTLPPALVLCKGRIVAFSTGQHMPHDWVQRCGADPLWEVHTASTVEMNPNVTQAAIDEVATGRERAEFDAPVVGNV